MLLLLLLRMMRGMVMKGRRGGGRRRRCRVIVAVNDNNVRGSDANTGSSGDRLLIDGDRRVSLIIESSRDIVAGRRVYRSGGGGGLSLEDVFQAGRRQIDAGDAAGAPATDGGR